MNPCPKPVPPGRKPPRRIERKSRPHVFRVGKLAEMKREADRLWGLLVRQRAGDRCEVPVVGIFARCPFVATDAAHIFRRGREASRLHLDNGIALCREHHESLGSAIVGERTRMGDLIVNIRGAETYEAVEWLAAQYGKFRPSTLDGLMAQAAAVGIK